MGRIFEGWDELNRAARKVDGRVECCTASGGELTASKKGGICETACWGAGLKVL